MASERKTKSRNGTPDDNGFDSDEPELIDDDDIVMADDDDVEEITSDDVEEITGEYEPFHQADRRPEDLEPIGRRRRSRRRPVRPRPEPAQDFIDEFEDTSPEREDDVEPWNTEGPVTGDAPGSDSGAPPVGRDDQDGDVRWSSIRDRPSAMPGVGPTRVDVNDQSPGAPGHDTLIFGDPDQQAEPEGPEAPFLVIVQGEEEGREIEITRDELTIGRGPDNDLVFPDIACSRRHAMLERSGDDWTVVDLGSGNGTLVNGERVQSEALQDGDEIEIGNTVLQFNLPGAIPAYDDEDEDVYEKTPVPDHATATGLSILTDSVIGRFLTRITADPRRRKQLMLGGYALGGLLLLMLIVKIFVPSGPPEPTADEIRRQQASLGFRKHMATAKTLVVQKKWKDALLEVQMAKSYEPDKPIVGEYLNTIQREMAASSAMEQARMFIEQKAWDGAVVALARIPGDSLEYRREADRMKKEIDELISGSLVNEGLALMREGKYNQALLKFDEVIKRNPDNEEVVIAKRQCEDEIDSAERSRTRSEQESSSRRRRRRTRRVKKKPAAGLTGQMLALYRNGEIERVIAKAELAGSSKNVVLLKQFRGTYEMGMQLAKQPGQADKALKALKKAYSIDKKISGGNGKYHQKLKTVLAKVYFVKGVDSHTRRRFPEAYQAYRAALRYKPDHSLAKGRLRELEKVAKKLYEEAYVIKTNNAERAIKLLNIVMKIVPPDHVYYSKAKRLRTSIQGPLGDDSDVGDGF